MAISAILWVIEHGHEAGLSGSEWAVAVSIANFVQENGGGCFAKVATIGKIVCLSERTTRDALRSLEAKGLIAVEQWATRRRPTTYCLPGFRAAAIAALDLSR